MKRFIFFIALFATVKTHAQNNNIGFTGGATFSNYKAKSGGNDNSGKTKAGFTVGAIANIGIGKNFIIQPGINFVQKGSQDKQTFFGVTSKYTLTTNHIEVPVNFLYTNSGFFIGAGPSFSFGVSGKLKYDFGGTKTNENVKFGNSENDDMTGFDIGANVLGGYRFKNGILIAANYNHGFRNLDNSSGPDAGTVNSRYFGIKLGYVLPGFKKK